MSRTGDEFSGPVKQRSGWLIPLAVFFVTASLSALVLAYYFAPTPPGLNRELPAPTDATRPIALQLGALHLHVPANYVVLASARRGGAVTRLALTAILPSFDGYSLSEAADFTANAPDSRVVYVILKSDEVPLPEQERLDRVYFSQVEIAPGASGAGRGAPGPYGLRQYRFRADSGYHDQDLFVGETQAGPVVLLCNKPGPDTPSPNCLRDTALGRGLGFSYRFKRTQLAQWKTIDPGLRSLITKFTDKK